MSSKVFKGNPAPVLIMDHLNAWPDKETLQLLAWYSDLLFLNPRTQFNDTNQ